MGGAAELVMDWARAQQFPARLRLYAPGAVGGIEPEARWVAATPVQRLAAALGSAVVAQGRSVAVLRGDELSVPGVAEALHRAQGVSVLSEAPAPTTCRAETWFQVDHLDLSASNPRLSEVAPVHLPGLIAWESAGASLVDLARDMPRILIAEKMSPWAQLGVTPFTAIALASAAEQGLRPVLSVAGSEIASWWDALAAIGSRNLPCCLRVHGRVPPLGWWQSLPGWWVTAPSPLSVRGVVTRALASRDPVAIIEPGSEEADGEGHEPGAGRWWLDVADAQVVIVAPGRARSEVLDAVAALTAMGLRCAAWEATSVVPLSCPRGRPVIAVEGDLAGFGTALRAEFGPQVPVLAAGATAADIAAAVRSVVEG